MPTPLPRPDQTRDDLEAALVEELTPALNQFIADMVDYLVAYHRDTPVNAVTAAGPFDPRHLQKADLLWKAALASTLLPSTAPEAFAKFTLPPAVTKAIVEVVKEWADIPRTKKSMVIRRSLTAPTKQFVENLARTEATTRWNKRYLFDVRRVMDYQRQTGTLQPTLKRWVSILDDRTRDSHADANGQVVYVNEMFTVGGHPMMHPGDPTAPASEVANCRCIIEIFQAEEAESMKILLASGAQGVTWHGTLVYENELTGDGRLIEPDALYWEDGGVPLRLVLADSGAHDGAVVVGRITDIRRSDGGAIEAVGFIDTGSEAGLEAQRLLSANLLNGVSVDLDDVSFEVRVKPDPEADDDAPPFIEASAADRLPKFEDMETVLEVNSGDEVMAITRARIRAATLVSIPAFANARIDLDDPLEDVDVTDGSAAAADTSEAAPPFVIVASAASDAPPAAWFDNPGLTSETPLTITADGRVFGHIATWRTEHIARPGTTPPTSPSDYKYFHTGAILTDDGKQLAIGRLTIGTGHAGDHDAPMKAMNHYDHTGTAVAYVRAGEDSHGIWVAGSIKPGATDEQVAELRASPPSGDWRRIGGALELVAVLCVNTAGFPVPRGLVASGHVQTFIAYGPAPTQGVMLPGLTPEQASALARMADHHIKVEESKVLATQTQVTRVRDHIARTRAQRVAARLNLGGGQ